MKNKLVFGLLLCTYAVNFAVFAQPTNLQDSTSNYVVIGAFKYESHARKWVKKAIDASFKPVSVLNKNRNLYYVYVMKTEDRPLAFEEAAKIRKDTTFWDTWVYRGTFTEEGPGGMDFDPKTRKTLMKVPGQTSSNLSSPIATIPQQATQPGITSEGKTLENGVPANGLPANKTDSAKVSETTDKVVATPGSKLFNFKITAAEGQNELPAKVDVIDIDRAKKSATYPGNEAVSVAPPGKSGNMSLVCNLFGYRPAERSLNFFNPLDSGGVIVTSDLITVPFELTRLQKGDFAVMYNVYFFKDAAVMRPESKYEVNSLLEMMKENPKYKIRIHGHTNGNASGKVVSPGDSKNFFSLNGSKEGYGSAKKLSEERAKMMRAWLINEGIDQKRMEIKAWGGKKPVYDKMSPQAQANVRVEIEILEDK